MQKKPRLTYGLAAIVGVLVIVAVARKVLADTVTSSTNPDAPNNTTEVTYTVTASDEYINDFHILPVGNGVLMGSIASMPEGWVGVKAGGGFQFRKSSGQPIDPNGDPGVFKLTIPDGQYRDGLVTWVTTDDNDYDPTDGIIDAGPGEGEPSTHGPVAFTDLNRDTVPINATTTFPIDSNLPLGSYAIYTFSTTSGMPDADDKTGIASWALQHPVSSGWNLTFNQMTGTVDANGDTSTPTVIVPNDSGLISEVFYLIAYVSVSDMTGTYWIGSGLKTITITAP